MNKLQITRRQWMQTLTGLAIPSLCLSCETINKNFDEMDHGLKTKLNRKVHWARRQEWTGRDMVKGIVRIEDRYLLVQSRDTMNWDFPCGLVNPEIHGPKSNDNQDLIRAATEYVNSLAMIQVVANLANLAAYGYAIDSSQEKTYMIHWLLVAVPTISLPPIHPNLRETVDARWVGLDDPELQSCLKKRIDEYMTAKEGGTILLEPCMR